MRRTYKYAIGDVIDAKIGKIIIDDIGIKKQNNGRNKTIYSCHCENGHKFTRYSYAMNSCPVCSGRSIVKGVNDISTTNPPLFNMLSDKNFGYTHAQHSNKKTDWICPDCNSIVKNVPPSQILRQGLPCKKCSDGISYGEKFIANLLDSCGIEYVKEYAKSNADWCKRYRYDFYLPKYDWIIEVHGLQHYEDCWNNKETVIENDKIKMELALKHVKKYIIIDARISDKKFLKKSILYSDLFFIIDPIYINWAEIHGNSLRSNIKKAAKMYNDGIMIKDISKKLHLHTQTITRYLKSASEVGICNYNSVDSRNNSYKIFKKNCSDMKAKPIICNENGFVFHSSRQCEIESDKLLGRHLSSSNIRKVLSGERHHTGSFTFSYITRSEFNRIKSKTPEKAYGKFFSTI